jgi:hypothetical protein
MRSLQAIHTANHPVVRITGRITTASRDPPDVTYHGSPNHKPEHYHNGSPKHKPEHYREIPQM